MDPRKIINFATDFDWEYLLKIDKKLVEDKARAQYVKRSIGRSECLVCKINEVIAGYAIFNKEFFDQTFVWILFTSPDLRKIGVATTLLQYIEAHCETPKLFTSTNQTNIEMQQLMDKLGFTKTGVVENLDPGDPEFFYFKRVQSRR